MSWGGGGGGWGGAKLLNLQVLKGTNHLTTKCYSILRIAACAPSGKQKRLYCDCYFDRPIQYMYTRLCCSLTGKLSMH